MQRNANLLVTTRATLKWLPYPQAIFDTIIDFNDVRKSNVSTTSHVPSRDLFLLQTFSAHFPPALLSSFELLQRQFSKFMSCNSSKELEISIRVSFPSHYLSRGLLDGAAWWVFCVRSRLALEDR